MNQTNQIRETGPRPISNGMNNPSDMERVVMRRVRLIRILGLVISTMVLAGLTLTATLWGIGREVWVARVFQNAPTDVLQLPNFFIAAFMHTRFVVQALSVLTFISLAFLVRETVRLLESLFFHKAV